MCSEGDASQGPGLSELQKTLERVVRSRKEKAREEQLAVLEVRLRLFIHPLKDCDPKVGAELDDGESVGMVCVMGQR